MTLERLIDGVQQNGQEIEAQPCVFCEIVARRATASYIAETDKSLALTSLEGHPLIVSKAHFVDDTEAHIEDTADAFTLAAQLRLVVMKEFNATAVNILANLGNDAGQRVSHFHVHVIPRTPKDRKGGFRELLQRPREVLDQIAARMKTQFALQEQKRPAK